MLLQIRKVTSGAIASLILGLVGLAMVVFLVPQGGLGNLIPSAHLAEVSGRKITPPQLSRELELTLRAQRNQGQNISQDEAIQAGLHTRLLESMIGRNAMYAYAEKAGVSASDAMVADYIRQIPGVSSGVSGAFDESGYAQFLVQMRYSRDEFESDVRGDLSAQLLMNALVAGVRAPSSFGELAFAYETETRVISIAEAPASAAGAVASPTEAQLQTFWEQNQEQLRVPEFRALTLVYARPQDFISRVNVTDAQLRQEFEARRASLATPERRTYVRISAQTQAQANDAAARLGRGETPEAIAAALSLQITRGADQARNEVPDARVAEAVFSQPRGTARAVQGQLTPWAVVRVEAITPGGEPSFESQRDALRQAIAADEAAELLSTALGQFEETRAAGGSVVEAARQTGLALVSIPPVEAGGRDQAGAPVAALEGQQDLLETAFQTGEGEASDFMPAGDADVLISVDRIVPATVRPLAEVREELSHEWVRRERVRRLRELGAEFVAAVAGGQSFEAAARAKGFVMRVASRPIDRRSAAQIPSRGLPPQIFAGAQGAVVSDMRVDGEALLVAQIEQINRANPAEAPQIVEAARAQIEEGLTQSLGQAAQDEIVARAHPRRNERLLQQLYPQNAEEAAQGQ